MRLASADFSWPRVRHELVLDLVRELGCEGVVRKQLAAARPVAAPT